eukprot:gene6083-5941_t
MCAKVPDRSSMDRVMKMIRRDLHKCEVRGECPSGASSIRATSPAGGAPEECTCGAGDDCKAGEFFCKPDCGRQPAGCLLLSPHASLSTRRPASPPTKPRRA